ncbi:MAG: carbohydrate ABC transporter permease [Proteobacteria bacterium]|nr:carbohydrate ABC transporter permease [Pseudomonadota bacterium]
MTAPALRRRLGFALYSLGAWCVVLLVTFPLLWMLSTAFKPNDETFALPPTLLPQHPTLEQFHRLLAETPFLTYALNSVIVGVSTTAIVIVLGVAAAYGLVRFRFPGREAVAQIVLFTYLLPAVVLLLPLYLMISRMGLANSLLGLVLAYVTVCLPFALWLLRSFIAGIPIDLEEAAMIDGASRMRAFIDVVLPQALPGIISTALFSFIMSWNEYLYALVFINVDNRKTLPPGVLTMLNQNQNVEWALLMAASVLMTLPVLMFFSLLQKHLTSGFGAGAVKG